MVKHMSPKEQDSVRKWVAHDKMTATQAATRLAKQRLKRGEEPLEDSGVYRFVSGKRTSKLVTRPVAANPRSLRRTFVRFWEDYW